MQKVKHEEGSHYRFGFKQTCPACKEKVEVQVDPYRVDNVIGPLPAPAFHILKKIMRGGKKGHDTVKLVREILCCAERWKQVLQENGEWDYAGEEEPQ